MKFSISLSVILCLTINFFCSVALAGGIGWEAEDGVQINPPMAVFEDATLSNGKCIYSPTSNEGSIVYEFEVPKDSTYFMWAYHQSVDAGRNSYHLVMDDANKPADDCFVWDTILDPQPTKLGEVVDIENKDSYDPEWGWTRVFGRDDCQWMLYLIRTFELETGGHTMYLWTRERETKIDAFYLSDNFNEQPVFPDEAPGILAVDPEEKLTGTWGSIKSEFQQ